MADVRHNFDETIAFIEAKGVCDEVDDDSTDSSLQVLNEFASIKR